MQGAEAARYHSSNNKVYITDDSRVRRTFLEAVDAYERALETHRRAVGAYAFVARLRRTAPSTPAPRAARQLLQDDRPTPLAVGNPLTPRQREVTALIARGYTNLQIATELVVEPGTVANHVAQVIDRLGVRNRTQVATWAVQHGLVHHAALEEAAPVA